MTDKHDELVERLTRFYREARTEVPTTTPAWILRDRQAGRWLRPVLASTALVAVAVSLGVALRIVREHAFLVRVTASPTVKASPLVTPTPSPAPTASWVTQRFSVGPVSALALDSSTVFALYAPSPVNGRSVPTKLVRIDRSSRAFVTADVSAGALQMTRAGSGLWIAPGGESFGTAANVLTLVDPVTLKLKSHVQLPARSDTNTYIGPQLSGTPSLLWLAYGDRVYRLNPESGSLLLSQTLPGTATSISIDPSGHRLYVGVEVFVQDQVIELDASTGARLASAHTGGTGLGGPHVAAAADGVWVSYATGMMGAVEHRSATNLAALDVAPQLYPNENVIRATNGIHVVVGGGALWLVDSMAQQITCADLNSGAMRASTSETLPLAIVVDSSGAYLGDNDGVATLQPDPACRH